MAGRILLVDDVPSSRALIKTTLTEAYFETVSAHNGTDALIVARVGQPDLIMVDAQLPGLDGFALCAAIKAEPQIAHIPVMILIPPEDDTAALRALDAGADDFIKRPLRDRALIARIKNLLRVKTRADDLRLRVDAAREIGLEDVVEPTLEADQEPGTILIAASCTDEAVAWTKTLNRSGPHRIIVAFSIEEAIRIGEKQAPDICVIAGKLGDGTDGLRLIAALRTQVAGRLTSILFALDGADPGLAEVALDVGATDYLLRPFHPNELTARGQSLMRRKRQSDRLRAGLIDSLKMAVTDPLTGLNNRRFACQRLDQAIGLARQTGGQVSALMLDLDRFKGVNDMHGHAAGDAVLMEFAQRVIEVVGDQDRVARLGGEEFLVTLPNATEDEALQMAEDLRLAVDELPFEVDQSGAIPVTVSIGVATTTENEEGAADLLARADHALYASKSAGRNVVTAFPDAA